MEVPTEVVAVAMTVADFNYCQETKFSRRGEPEVTRKPQVIREL
jgi:hypothetical protein